MRVIFFGAMNNLIVEYHTDDVPAPQVESTTLPDDSFLRSSLVYKSVLLGLIINPVYSIASNDCDYQGVLCEIQNIKKSVNDLNFLLWDDYTSKENFRKSILSFVNLREKWDGYDALPTTIEIANNALKIIDKLYDFSLSNKVSILNKVSDIFPDTDGTIGILCKNFENERISLSIGTNKMSYYVSFNGQNKIYADNVPVSDKEIEKWIEYVSYI